MLLTEPTYNRTPGTALAWRARKLSQEDSQGWRQVLGDVPCRELLDRRTSLGWAEGLAVSPFAHVRA
jgi:hypothetical protein